MNVSIAANALKAQHPQAKIVVVKRILEHIRIEAHVSSPYVYNNEGFRASQPLAQLEVSRTIDVIRRSPDRPFQVTERIEVVEAWAIDNNHHIEYSVPASHRPP